MPTVKQVSEGAVLPEPIYVHRPYVVLSKSDPGVVLASGKLDYIVAMPEMYAGYYNDCEVEVRKYDVYLANNSKVEDMPVNRFAGFLKEGY